MSRSLAAASLVASLMATGLAGCAVGPEYVRPRPVLPERFHGQSQLDQRQAAADADLVRWWEGFGDPQLTRVVTLALAQNLDLARAAAKPPCFPRVRSRHGAC